MAAVLIKKVPLPAPCSRLCVPASIRCRTHWAWSVAHCNTCDVMGSGVALLLLLFPCCSASLAGWLLCSNICCTLSLSSTFAQGWPTWQLCHVNVLRCGIEWGMADTSVTACQGINSNGDGCVTAESCLEGLGSLAQLCWLLNCEQQMLRLGTPFLGLGTHTLAVGTVLDVLKPPLVRGFVTAAGWLPPGVFWLWCGISWATLGPVHVGVLGLGLSGTNTGLAWFWLFSLQWQFSSCCWLVGFGKWGW